MKLWKSLLATVLMMLMLMTMVVPAMAYSDVRDGNEYMEYIKIADQLGVMPASTQGDFYPHDYFTRGDAIVAVYRMLHGSDEGLFSYESADEVFTDVPSDHGLFPYIAWAYDTSLITNELETAVFSPAQPITQDELLTLLVKVLQLEKSGESLEYATGYVDKAGAFASNMSGGEEPVLRQEAAQVLVEALWFQDEDTMIDVTLLEDDDGNRLDCLVTNVFGLNQTDLVIRGTRDRSMGFDIEKDVLLSNGYHLDCDEDMSNYIGYTITVTYSDKDHSATLTQDEEIVSYEVNSAMMLQPALSSIFMTSHTLLSFTELGFDFTITNFTEKYYNDDLWPADDFANLIDAAGGVGNTIRIMNRPNLTLNVVPDESGKRIQYIFATEQRPGKIVDITGTTYTIRDYYQRDTDKEYQKFDISDIVFSGASTSEGDYINFYTSRGKCYITDGSTVVTKIKENMTGNQLMLDNGTIVTPHMYFKRSSQLAPVGAEVAVVVDNVAGSHYFGWEYVDEIMPKPVMVKSAATVMGGVQYLFYDCESGTDFEVTIETDNIHASSQIKVGEFLYYSKDTSGAEKVERARYDDRVKLGVETEGYFVESSTGRILTKSDSYYGNLYTDTFKEDYYRVIYDIAGNVLALA